ncbi:TonB-dependent receptor [Dasania marina]|uniref:TonB-dependent receptor n=1 Tax=Dasania marina TaxID=471499 RepID=UPI0030DBA4CC|tara:strand:+ start:2565 stop:4913 length:2349 start_codon:yes stop_codon:yes gene_type:complete
MKFKKKTLSTVIGTTALMSSIGASAAGPELEELIVTATQRDSSIYEIPYNISAVSGEAVEAAGVADLSDISRVAPGIAFMDQGPRVVGNNYIILRGLNANTQSGAADVPLISAPAVSVYMGSVPIFSNFSMTDLARVEILRGPQGTLYGSGSLGGTLRFIPNQPGLTEASADLTAEISSVDEGDDLSYNVSGIFNLPVSDQLAFRVVAGYRELAGFVDSVGLIDPDSNGYPTDNGDGSYRVKSKQKDSNKSDNWYLRTSALYEASDALSFLLSYQHEDVDTKGRQAHSYDIGVDSTDKYVQRLAYEEPMTSETDLLSLDVEVDFGFAVLSSSTSVATQKAEWTRDATGLYDNAFYWYKTYYYPFATNVSYGESEDEKIVQEFRLASTGGDTLDWVVGAFYMDQDFTVDEEQFIPGLTEHIASDPYTYALVTPTTDLVYAAEREVDYKDMAVFGELTAHISDEWQVTGGARFFKQEFDQSFVFHAPFCPSLYYQPATGTCGSDADGISTSTFLDEDVSDHILKFNTSYDITYETKVYMTVAEGFRHGGANAVPTAGPWPEEIGLYDTFDADEALNKEIGIKGKLFDARHSYTVSIFHIDWDKPQFDTFTQDFHFSSVVNGPDAVSKGFELELKGLIGERLSYSFGYNYTRSEWAEDGFVGRSPLKKGGTLPGIPKHMATFSTDYYLPVSMGEVVFHLNGFYRSEADTAPNESWENFKEIDSFSMFDASVGLETETWGAKIFIDNLTNEEGTTGGQTAEGYGQYAYNFLSRPRSIGLRFNYKIQ